MNDDLTQLAQALEQIEGLRGVIARQDAEVERLQGLLLRQTQLVAEVERLSGLAESYSDLLHERQDEMEKKAVMAQSAIHSVRVLEAENERLRAIECDLRREIDDYHNTRNPLAEEDV
jgi:cell division protein FtsB